MLDFIAKYFRYPLAVVLSFVVSAVFFLAIPVINALFFDKGVKTEKELEKVTEVEVLVSENKPEVKQKVLRTIVNPNPFKISSHAGMNRSQNFQMDLSLARGAAGDGVAVGTGSMENVVYEAGEVDEQAQVLKETQPKFPDKAKRLGVSGYVKVMIVIDVYGDVAQASVMSQDPPGYGFDVEALKAVRQWKFSPAQLGGYPVAQKATKEFRFVK
ncbi:energy transducer TonB [Fibrobacter sp. UWP2]|uniref:energy transducer TonB n=1 Tax=Fibrobacter sp. UWP2 TaxID=1896216 RepID=UPI00091FC7D5|nr:energy transducer TonB [Fibrobacter sp. UWP2]SHJ38796.1 outer membrane transport energization protein TonB [Fibrobacter sp. UWP2]